MTTPRERLADFLRHRRRVSRLTQGALAQAAGVHQTLISQIECERLVPTVRITTRLAAALSLTEPQAARWHYLIGAAKPLRRGSPAWRAILRANGFQPGNRIGRRHRFRKGHIPWNNGLKGLHLSPATEFQPGCLRGNAARNWRPIGHITIRRDKTRRRRRFIKIREDGPPQHRYIPLARFNYERYVGPIPSRQFVVHRDGDTLNDTVGNLMLMDRRNLFTWQTSLRPQIAQRRRTRLATANRRRWAHYRALSAFRRKVS